MANCYNKGNHVAFEPQTIMSNVEFMMEHLEEITGKTYNPVQPQGAEILFVVPSGDLYASSRAPHVHGLHHAARGSWG